MAKLKNILKFVYEYSHLLVCAVGVCCIIFQEQIIPVLPYVFGAIMILIGVSGIVLGLLRLLVNDKKSQVFSYSFLVLILGVIFISKHANEESVAYIGISWGIMGLFRAGSNIIIGITEARERKFTSIITLNEAAFTLIVSIMILLEPIHSIPEHVLLLGIELIAVSICTVFGIHGGFSLWHLIELNEEKHNSKCAKESSKTQVETETQTEK